MRLKAGTYTFNNVLTQAEFEQDIDFILTASEDGITGDLYCSKINGGVYDGAMVLIAQVYKSVIDGVEEDVEGAIPLYGSNGWTVPIISTAITEDTDVSNTFGTWYIANTDYITVNNGEIPEPDPDPDPEPEPDEPDPDPEPEPDEPNEPDEPTPKPERPKCKFTRLYSGGVAYSSNGKGFRKLQTEEYVIPQIVNITHKLIANIPVDGTVMGISKIYDGVIYVTAWNSTTYLTTIYEVNVESGEYKVLYSKVFYASKTEPENVIKVNGDLYISFYDTTHTVIIPDPWVQSQKEYTIYTHIVNLTQNKVLDYSFVVAGTAAGATTPTYGGLGYYLSHTSDSIYVTFIYSQLRRNFFCRMRAWVYKVELDLSGQTRVIQAEREKDSHTDSPDYYWGRYYGNISGSISKNTYTKTFNSSYTTISNSTYANGVLFDIGSETFFVSGQGYYGKFNRETGIFTDDVKLGISVLSTTNGETVVPVASSAGAIYVLQQTDK